MIVHHVFLTLIYLIKTASSQSSYSSPFISESGRYRPLMDTEALRDAIVGSERPVVHGAIGSGQKSFMLLWRCHQLLSWFLAKDHFPRVSLQSLMIRMIPGAVDWSPYRWGKRRNTSARRPSDEGAVRPFIALKWGPFPPNEVGRIAQHFKTGEGRKKGKDGELREVKWSWDRWLLIEEINTVIYLIKLITFMILSLDNHLKFKLSILILLMPISHEKYF